jgi:hypothetical protein
MEQLCSTASPALIPFDAVAALAAAGTAFCEMKAGRLIPHL